MLNITELRNGAVFQENGQILQVLTYEHVKMGRGSGTVKLKVKNLKTGSITEKSFITGARVEEANVVKQKAQFLYQDGTDYIFMDPVSFEQFTVASPVVGDNAKFLKEGLEVTLIISNDEALGVELPNTIIFEIKETGPSERGNTVSNVYKKATMDNGLIVKVPMFMKASEKIKVDTRTCEYVERIK